MTWICQLSRRWGPFLRGSKMFGASLRPGKDIWRQFFAKYTQFAHINESHAKKIASKKVKNLLKTAVSAGRQSHPRNGEHVAPHFRVHPRYGEHAAPHFEVHLRYEEHVAPHFGVHPRYGEQA